jgi:signal transduction histidine kinase
MSQAGAVPPHTTRREGSELPESAAKLPWHLRCSGISPELRILLVEDDRKASRVLARGLEEEGFVVDVAHSGEDGEELAAVNDYDLIVLENLLSNAVKFSPPHGRVTIRTLAAGSEALLSVSDSGPGIPPDEIPRLFERFFRGRAAQAPGAPGVGLGLAICRAVVEARGGRITADSRPGAGATFTVHLPLAASVAGQS